MLLCGVYLRFGDVSGAIYKIGKIMMFLPKLYFFNVGGLDLIFRCSVGVIWGLEVYLVEFYFWFYFHLIFLCQKGFSEISRRFLGDFIANRILCTECSNNLFVEANNMVVDYNRLERTWKDKWVCFKLGLGISWEFRGKNLELLGLIIKELQFYLGTSWE